MTTVTIHTRGASAGPATNYLDVARRYAANPEDWPFAPRFNPQQRWYQRLAVEQHSEIWVLSWLPGQGTDLHDHGGSAGAFVVLCGVLTEHTLADPQRRSSQLDHGQYSTGHGRSFDGHHIHQIINTGNEPAVSLHVYSPVLREMARYQIADGRVVVTAVDRAGADW